MNELTISDSNSGKQVHPYRWGVISGCGLTVACVTYTLSAFIAPAFRRVCLPFVPATPVQLDNIAKILLAQRKSACSSTLGPIVDLGSGDGRVLINLMQRKDLGFTRGVGVELNRPLIWYSRWNAYRAGMGRPLLKFRCCDMWKVDLSEFQTVVVFGVDSMMGELENKLRQELKPNTFVVASRFPLPSLPCADSIEAGPDSVYFYRF
ncbi:hypothetical protein T265_08091 [Opisthorchis viverrini]|uniref:Methyltransferase domain-containing protein n=1 Tax=Opisthorchis viverrini TaxID=6198 RepID=A0A074ZF01_OPIVI|nr:hypothetical protein T265_08091 [Opisthorchis viverrini]KER24202.1 hypothetical protein T265_08091 [Opisthorchis viverrini]